MSALLGWLWWTALPVRKRLAVNNYRAAFPERDPGELRQTVSEMFWSYIDLIRGAPSTIFDVEIMKHGGIALAGHGVGWDLSLIRAAQQVPVTIFVKAPTNPLAASIIRRLRAQADLELLPPRGSMASAYRALERGRVVAFVQDQRHNAGLPVPFFGRPARTSPAFASMAWRTRAPLFGAWPSLGPTGGYQAHIERLDWEIPESREEAIARLTERSALWYEQKIRQHPRGWLWLHDRWR